MVRRQVSKNNIRKNFKMEQQSRLEVSRTVDEKRSSLRSFSMRSQNSRDYKDDSKTFQRNKTGHI